MNKKLNNNQSEFKQDKAHYMSSADIEIPIVLKKIIKRVKRYKELRKKHDYDYEAEPLTAGDYERRCKQISAYKDLRNFVSKHYILTKKRINKSSTTSDRPFPLN